MEYREKRATVEELERGSMDLGVSIRQEPASATEAEAVPNVATTTVVPAWAERAVQMASLAVAGGKLVVDPAEVSQDPPTGATPTSTAVGAVPMAVVEEMMDKGLVKPA